ncbi:MAG TPA: hypothetical protein VKQ30_26095 [Ktedonobacterales bacterium]|nr:hypothetical protein [Ktedonobacterales bacterium]
MNNRRPLWTPQAWTARLSVRQASDAPVHAEDSDISPSVHQSDSSTATDLMEAQRPSVDDQPTLKMRALQSAPSVDEMPTAPALPAGIPSGPVRHSAAPHHLSRWTATMLTILLLLLTNLVLEFNRRSFDVLSEHFPDAALARVQRCETLGQVPDVIYMGSSLTMHGVIPTTVDATVQADSGQRILSCNVADDGSTFEEDYYTLKRMIEDGYTPKLVVETLWEYNVNAHASPPADTFGLPAEQILSLADISDAAALSQHFGGGIHGKLAALNYIAGKAIPFYGDRTAMFKSLCGSLTIGPCATTVTTSVVASPLQKMVLPSDARGWVALVGRSLATYTDAQLRPYTSCGDHCPPFVFGEHQTAFLARFIALAQAHHIHVALVIPPFSQYFFHVMRPADWQKLVSLWQSFAGAPGVAFYDESHDPTYLDTDFWDVHHLDVDGAMKFSTWIGQTLVPRELSNG